MFINRKGLSNLFFGQPKHPQIPNLRATKEDTLYFDSLTRGGLVIGKPGVGKTIKCVMEAVRYALEYPDRPIFSLDASGSFTNEFIQLVYQLPREQRELIERRIVYDRMGDQTWCVPMPYFSPDYGLQYEEQVQRVAKNYKKLNHELITLTPVMAIAITETLPELSRLLCAIQNEHGECWQITEAKKLLLDQNTLAIACKKFGNKVPDAKWYFENELLGEQVTNHERERRTFTLRSVLGSIGSRPIRARLGYSKPGWTPKEAIEKGLIVLVSGEELINQEEVQSILFTDVYSQILAQINKRIPHDPNDKHVLLVIDEVYSLIRIPGMAEEIGKVSPQYRSRRLQIVVVIQALWQLADNLKEQIWSLGNVICFGVEDFNEAYRISQQLFKYDPKKIKLPPASESGHPIIEPDRGGYLIGANWIQHLKKRECIMKRYIDEGEEEPFIGYVEMTSEKPDEPLVESLVETKDSLLRRRAIPVGDALKIVNTRNLSKMRSKKRQIPSLNN